MIRPLDWSDQIMSNRMARGMGSSRQILNRWSRAHEDPEPASCAKIF